MMSGNDNERNGYRKPPKSHRWKKASLAIRAGIHGKKDCICAYRPIGISNVVSLYIFSLPREPRDRWETISAATFKAFIGVRPHIHL